MGAWRDVGHAPEQKAAAGWAGAARADLRGVGHLPAEEAPRRALRKCAGDMSAAVNHPSEGDVRLLAVAELVEVGYARKLDHGRRAAPAGARCADVSRTCP